MTTHSATTLSGVNDASIPAGSQTGLNISGSITLSNWVRPSEIDRVHNLHGRDNGTSGEYGYLLRINASNQLEYRYSTDGSTTYTATTSGLALVNDRWLWVGAVFKSGTPAVQFYKNGELLGEEVPISGNGVIGTPAVDYRIANTYNGDTDSNLRGYIDQVRVFDDERTGTEMFTDFFDDVSAVTNLQGGWSLDDVWTDISGNGNTLTASGLVFTEDEVHGYTSGSTTSGTLLAGTSSGSNFNYVVAYALTPVSTTVSGTALIYVMRGYDTNISLLVFWTSSSIDTDASDYTGTGPVNDVVVHKVVGT